MTPVSGGRKIERCTGRLRSNSVFPGLGVHLPHAQGETRCPYCPKIKVVMQAHGMLQHLLGQNHGTGTKVISLDSWGDIRTQVLYQY